MLQVGVTAVVISETAAVINEIEKKAFEKGRAHEHRENYLKNPAKNILSDIKIQNEIRFAFGYTNSFDQFIIDLMLEKAASDNNEAAQNKINSLKKQNDNILDNINEQNEILAKINCNAKFKPFVKDLILNKANSFCPNNSPFKDFNSFYFFAQNNYNLSAFIQIYNNKDVSQITNEEKKSIVSRFELLTQSEKNKFDLHKLFELKNRDLELLLINHISTNIEITDRNDYFKSNFQDLILDNNEIPNNELADYFLQNFVNPESETYIKNPFLRLFIFLQLVGNSYSYSELNKIINKQDYDYLKNELKNEEFFSYFLFFYQHLDNIELDEDDKKLLKKYQEPLSPRDLFCNAIKIGCLVALPISFASLIVTYLLTAAFTGFILPAFFAIPIVIGLSPFIITPICFLIGGINNNKMRKRKQNQFKPEKNIPQETQSNPEITNDVNTQLLANVTQNEISSDNGMPNSASLKLNHVL